MAYGNTNFDRLWNAAQAKKIMDGIKSELAWIEAGAPEFDGVPNKDEAIAAIIASHEVRRGQAAEHLARAKQYGALL